MVERTTHLFFFNETLLQHRYTTYNTKASLLQKTKTKKTKRKRKNYTTYNTIACTATYNAKTNTTHNYLHYNCKTTHTHTTHALILGQGIVFSRLRLLLLLLALHVRILL